MVLVILGAAILVLLAWHGRRPVRIAGVARLWAALAAALAAVAAVVSALRGDWIVSLVLIALSAWVAQRAKLGMSASEVSDAPDGGMDVEEARSILGVDGGAGRAEIVEAYRRLMRRAHPDHGGSTGLAAKLNAARDVLLRRTGPAP